MIAAIIVITIAVIWLFSETNYMRVKLSRDYPPMVESHKKISESYDAGNFPQAGNLPAELPCRQRYPKLGIEVSALKIPLLYLGAITVAEVITIAVQPLWGIIGHTVILMSLIVHSAVAAQHPHRELLLSTTLAPLVRIISLSMPLADIPQILWYPVIYVTLAFATVMVMRVLGYSKGQVGFTIRRLSIQLPVALLVGIVLGIAKYLILTPEAMISELTWQELWLPALIFLLCIGFVEEFIFRGVLQRSAVDAFGSWWGIVYVSLVFAILHMGFFSWVDVVFVFIIAMLFGWVVNKTGSLFGVTLAHGVTNIMLYLVVPFFF